MALNLVETLSNSSKDFYLTINAASMDFDYDNYCKYVLHVKGITPFVNCLDEETYDLCKKTI